MRRLQGLNCGEDGWPELERLGVRYVAVHAGLYHANPLVRETCLAPARTGLLRHGFRVLAHDGAVTMFVRR
jgi:hypothetical protein